MDILPSIRETSSLHLIRTQRSHVLFVLSDAKSDDPASFLKWYRGPYRDKVARIDGVIAARYYERHELDITQGHFAPIPLRYLTICELSRDGAPAAEGIIDRITAAHEEEPTARAPATWLYYPASEKVGRSASQPSPQVTLAFANGTPGQESEFREWYATRHIRHALNIPALVSGQCFERTLFQKPGTLEARFSTIAVYEQEGTPESIIESFKALPPETFSFPSLDLTRFAESVYRSV